MIGNLWLLLIKFAGEFQLVEDGHKWVMHKSDQKVLCKSYDTGSHIWQKLESLIEPCERAMYKDQSRNIIYEDSCIRFVETLVGSESGVLEIQRLMTDLDSFNRKFVSQCVVILRSLRK